MVSNPLLYESGIRNTENVLELVSSSSPLELLFDPTDRIDLLDPKCCLEYFREPIFAVEADFAKGLLVMRISPSFVLLFSLFLLLKNTTKITIIQMIINARMLIIARVVSRPLLSFSLPPLAPGARTGLSVTVVLSTLITSPGLLVSPPGGVVDFTAVDGTVEVVVVVLGVGVVVIVVEVVEEVVIVVGGSVVVEVVVVGVVVVVVGAEKCTKALKMFHRNG